MAIDIFQAATEWDGDAVFKLIQILPFSDKHTQFIEYLLTHK